MFRARAFISASVTLALLAGSGRLSANDHMSDLARGIAIGAIISAYTGYDRITTPEELPEADRLALQHDLRELGFYEGQLDGVWGASSADALQRFKSEREGLGPDATFAATVRLLGEDAGRTTPIRLTTRRSARVPGSFDTNTVDLGAVALADAKSATDLDRQSQRYLQLHLLSLGYYSGTVDGLWGPASRQALDRFRQGADLPADTPFPQVVLALYEAAGTRYAGDPQPTPVSDPGTPAGPIQAARLFVSQELHPPEGVRGYGMFVFKSVATDFDRERHAMLCQAYVASQVSASGAGLHWPDLFITVWPVGTTSVAQALNDLRGVNPSLVCDQAVAHYDLELARDGLSKARLTDFKDDGIGPYLLGWLPSSSFGQPDALILQLDLSQVEDYRQALALFQQWKSDIESDPQLNGGPGTLAILKRKLRIWADTHGQGLFSLVGG